MYRARITYSNGDLGELHDVTDFEVEDNVIYFLQSGGHRHIVPLERIVSVNLEKME